MTLNILVTNDDGIDSAGLHVLAERMADLGAVTVFAPAGEYSGAGAAIGHLGVGIGDVHRVERPEMASADAVYHLDGPPALAALLACRGIFGDVPDLVVSGINPGWNVGHAVHFSGTIGACITAGVFAIPGIAVSQTTGGKQHWVTAADAAADRVDRALRDNVLLNVNVPNLPGDQIKGTRETSLADRVPYGLHSPTLRAVENAHGRFNVGFEKDGPFESPDGSDTHAVEAGYISITPLVATAAAPLV